MILLTIFFKNGWTTVKFKKFYSKTKTLKKIIKLITSTNEFVIINFSLILLNVA